MINSKVGKETGRTNFFHWQIMSRLLAAFALAAAGAFAAYLYGRCTLPPPTTTTTMTTSFIGDQIRASVCKLTSKGIFIRRAQ